MNRLDLRDLFIPELWFLTLKRKAWSSSLLQWVSFQPKSEVRQLCFHPFFLDERRARRYVAREYLMPSFFKLHLITRVAKISIYRRVSLHHTISSLRGRESQIPTGEARFVGKWGRSTRLSWKVHLNVCELLILGLTAGS